MPIKPLDAVQIGRTAALAASQQHVALNAFISKADPVQRHGLLNCAVKDNIVTTQLPTTCASGILQNHRSPFGASLLEFISARYPIHITGKTNMDEFGMGSHSLNSFFGPVVAPVNPSLSSFHGERDVAYRYSAGGSSGGSAVAVMTHESQVALGTDTGGSVRLPAAYTGMVGFKPSYGVISRWGIVPYANSLDTVGVLAVSASDAKDLFKAMRRSDQLDPTCLSKDSRKRIIDHTTIRNDARDFSKFKIGVPSEYNIEELHPSIRAAWQKVLKAVQDRGCTVVPISLPTTKHALSAYYVLAAAEAMSNLAKYDGVRYGTRNGDSDGIGEVLYSETRGSGFGEEVQRRILLGSYTLSSEAMDNYFVKAQKVRRLVQRDFDRVFSLPNLLRPTEQFDLSDMEESIQLDNKLGPSQVDFIICPTAPTLPPSHIDVRSQATVDTYMNDVFTVPASLAGLPAISFPVEIPSAHKGEDELPAAIHLAGIQIIGQYADDTRVLDLAIELNTLLAEYKREDGKTGRIRKIIVESASMKRKEFARAADLRRRVQEAEDMLVKMEEGLARLASSIRKERARRLIKYWHSAKRFEIRTHEVGLPIIKELSNKKSIPHSLTESEIDAELTKYLDRWENRQAASTAMDNELDSTILRWEQIQSKDSAKGTTETPGSIPNVTAEELNALFVNTFEKGQR